MSENEPLDFFQGGGEMGERMRALDWARTPLGPTGSWPQALKTAVSIVLNSRYAMFVWWGPQLINLYNDAYRPFLGAKHPASLGRSAADVWSEIWHLIGPRTDAVLARGEATFDEALLLIMDRYGYPEETYFTFSYSPIRDDQGQVGGIFCAVTDETSRIIGERRLKLLREVAAGVAESHTADQVCAAAVQTVSREAHDLPFVWLYLIEGSERRVRLVARAGIDRDDPTAGKLMDPTEDGSVPTLEEAIAANEELIIDGPPSRFERLPTGPWDRPPERAVVLPLRERGQTGAIGALVAGLNPYLPYEEGYRGFIRLFADQIAAGISNARAYEAERRRAEALAEIDRAKTTFFSNISHEFRTPLTLMLGPLEELLAKPEAAPDEQSLVSVAHRNGLRLLRLVNNLLDFARIEAGRLQASYEPTDLAALTAELASNFRSACERAGLSLSVDCPPLAEPVYVDREMWEKIVLNLVSNAFKFTRDGGIKISLATEDGHAILRVADTGAGIPETELPLIFDRFHRVEGVAGRTHEGTGIGLALVQELVKLHHGSINVESTVGHGTTFVLRIPLGSTHLPAERMAANAEAASRHADAFVSEAVRPLSEDGDPLMMHPTPVVAGVRPRLVLADDNADMRQYLNRLLATSYEVTAVADGKQALAAAARVHPDVILTDVMMPGLDGFALLRQLKADPELLDIPVILLSARAGEEAKVEGLARGATDYLVKPFSARDLLARVSAAVDRKRVRNAVREEAQRQLDSRYRLLVEAVTDYAIYMLDADGVVTSWNPGARRFKGYDAAEIIGQHFSCFYTEEDRQAGLPAKTLATAEREGKFEGEGWRVRKNGERFWASVIVDAIRDPSGRLIGYAKVTRDLTERLETQRTLEKARERTTQSQKMEAVGQLTGGVAHDFNNLLTAILGSLELLQRRMPTGQPQLMRLVDNAIRGAERGAALTQRMLAFARRQELDLGPVDIPTLVRGMSELLERSLGPSVLIDIRFPLSLARVTADPNQLEMAVLNLVVNARDAMQNGGTIVISARPVGVTHGDESDLEPGRYVCLSVQDTGEGMDEATLIRAMDPFFTTKGPGKGTGLGLSMVQGLAEQSGGRLFLKSRKGEGTTAELWLPVAAVAVAAPPVSEPEGEKEIENASLVILVVDDDSLVLTNMAAMLEDLGHRVLEASSGRQALEILSDDSTIDLVMTDHAMPGMTGLQLIEQIKTQRPDLPVILATGYAELPPDADPVLPRLAKPFRQYDIAQVVSTAIQLGRRPASRVVRFRQPSRIKHKT